MAKKKPASKKSVPRKPAPKKKPALVAASATDVDQAERQLSNDLWRLRDLENRKADEALRQRKLRAISTSIGVIPPVKNPNRKALCRDDLHLFLAWYFPNSTGIGPFGPPQIELVNRFQLACKHPSRFLSILSRGFGKSTVAHHSLIWASVYGHSLNSVYLGANDSLASESINSIKRELLFNPRLAEDFPEICHPVKELDNKPQRAAGQSYQAEDGSIRLTMMAWTSNEIVFPTIEGAPSSGCIVQSLGLEAASRGLSYKRPDGKNVRPSIVVIDDPQTDKSARSTPEILRRSEIVRKGVSRLGGHGSKTSIIINATPIAAGDLIEQLSDRKLHPGWSKVFCPYFPRMQSTEELQKHWLGPYARILTGFDESDLDGQVKAEKAAMAYYIEHREEMDAGFEVAWPSIPCEANESKGGIEHGMRIYILEGADVFASECQLSPIKPKQSETLGLVAEDIAARTNGYARAVVPRDTSHLTFGIDCHDEILYWTVAAVANDFSGSIVDYGSWPEQPGEFFTHQTVRNTLALQYPGEAPERCVELGIEDLLYSLINRGWRDANGEERTITAGLVDLWLSSDASSKCTSPN